MAETEQEAELRRLQLIDELLADTAPRPLHPTFAGLRDGWIDPTARDVTFDGGEALTARERTVMSSLSYHGAEGLMGALTPLAMAEWASTMLGFLSVTETELKEGYKGIDVDPWGEVAAIPEQARMEFRRASWHIDEALVLMGLVER